MTDQPPARIVTLVLVDPQGGVLGELPPFTADTPWWMDMAPVVRAVRARHGITVTVLRLLAAERPAAHGGAVTYLAEVDPAASLPAMAPWHGTLPADPKRLPYAEVGGPRATLAWAAGALHAHGDEITTEAEQIRTWNLSSIWRLPTRRGGAWLKVVPPFFAHEGAMLDVLRAHPVPRLIARDGTRILLAHLGGTDGYDAPLPMRLAMIDMLVGIQHAMIGRVEALRSLGLPDWRGPALTASARALIARRTDALDMADRALLATFVDTLPARFDAIAACGLPDTLVHSDFHPGNVRIDGDNLTLLDWGDCGIGHPLLDLPPFLDATPAAEREVTRAHWHRAWHAATPNTDVARAAALLEPVGLLRKALIYQNFLDGIEATEHPYHRSDVPDFLHRTAACVRAEHY